MPLDHVFHVSVAEPPVPFPKESRNPTGQKVGNGYPQQISPGQTAGAVNDAGVENDQGSASQSLFPSQTVGGSLAFLVLVVKPAVTEFPVLIPCGPVGGTQGNEGTRVDDSRKPGLPTHPKNIPQPSHID